MILCVVGSISLPVSIQPWSSGTTYNSNSIVIYNDKIVKSRHWGNLNHIPDVSNDYCRFDYWWQRWDSYILKSWSSGVTMSDRLSRVVGTDGNYYKCIIIGFGDAVTPAPTEIEYPTILNLPAPRLRAYHPVTVIAEKVNAMVVHGFMNSRMKDFYDVYILLNHMNLDDDLLAKAIRATFDRRKIVLPEELPVAFTIEFLEDGIKETQWKAFLNRSNLSDFKLTFAEVVDDLRKRLWPVIQKARK